MTKTQEQGSGRRTTWRNPVLRFEGTAQASADAVYGLLEDLQSHLEWAGRRQLETTRLLTLKAPPSPAKVGTEFFTTGSDGKVARWADRSVVTEATRPQVFEFVTEGRREGKPGIRPWVATAVHRYEITPASGGCRISPGAPRIMLAPGISRIVFRISAKYMRRGFDGLLALAEERAGIR